MPDEIRTTEKMMKPRISRITLIKTFDRINTIKELIFS